MNLYEGLYLRRSVRSYRMEPVEEELLHYLEKFLEHLEMLDLSQRVHFDLVANTKREERYGGLLEVRAPYYLVVSAKPSPNYLVNAGFMLEQAMLYLLTKGLATCFLQYRGMPLAFAENYEPVVMLAFGRSDKNLYREAQKAKRKSLKEVAVWKTAVSDEIKWIVNAGRLAPSFWNSQPWRFVVYENRIHLFCRKNPFVAAKEQKLRKVDAGIALANLYLAAEELWYRSEIVVSENIAERTFQNNEYLVTLILSRQ